MLTTVNANGKCNNACNIIGDVHIRSEGICRVVFSLQLDWLVQNLSSLDMVLTKVYFTHLVDMKQIGKFKTKKTWFVWLRCRINAEIKILEVRNFLTKDFFCMITFFSIPWILIYRSKIDFCEKMKQLRFYHTK